MTKYETGAGKVVADLGTITYYDCVYIYIYTCRTIRHQYNRKVLRHQYIYFILKKYICRSYWHHANRRYYDTMFKSLHCCRSDL